MKKVQSIGLILGIIFLTSMTLRMILDLKLNKREVKTVSTELIKFTIEDMKKFDGTNTSLPIYLAYEGDVYDVTSGKKYYEPGGVYHFLTGKDATTELNIAGGGIIKNKYRVIGIIIK